MPKPDPSLLDPSRYTGRHVIMPRFGDLDYNMHVNNSAMAMFMEDARFCYNRSNGFYDDLGESKSMLVSIAIEYLDQTHVNTPVTVHSAYERLGRSSLTLLQLVMQDERAVAFSRGVVVTATSAGVAMPLPTAFVEKARALMLRP